jgi:hypothetical protein
MGPIRTLSKTNHGSRVRREEVPVMGKEKKKAALLQYARRVDRGEGKSGLAIFSYQQANLSAARNGNHGFLFLSLQQVYTELHCVRVF